MRSFNDLQAQASLAGKGSRVWSVLTSSREKQNPKQRRAQKQAEIYLDCARVGTVLKQQQRGGIPSRDGGTRSRNEECATTAK